MESRLIRAADVDDIRCMRPLTAELQQMVEYIRQHGGRIVYRHDGTAKGQSRGDALRGDRRAEADEGRGNKDATAEWRLIGCGTRASMLV